MYRSYNQQIAHDLNVTYIDLRQAYLDAVPSYHKGFRHCVTVDGNTTYPPFSPYHHLYLTCCYPIDGLGNHPSTNGAYINAYKISQTLLEWFGSGMSVGRQSNTVIHSPEKQEH